MSATMDDMRNGQHEAAGAGLRRARTAAWIVTVVMGGTTMAFQVYHAVKFGGMPWELAALYGIVPLLIALLILEIVAEWRAAPWPAKAAAYAIMAAAMFLSASATGAVVLHAAPGHFSLLPGALLDAAELLAAFFILNGPSAAQAVAAVARREAELLAKAAAERSAREQAEAAGARAIADLRADLRAQLETAGEAHSAVVGDLEAQLVDMTTAREEAQREAALRPAAEAAAEAARTAEEAARTAQETAERARAEAEQRAAKAEADLVRLARKLGTGVNGKPSPKDRKAPATAVPDDFDARAEALAVLSAEPGISGRELAERVGKSERWGQQFKKDLAGSVPGGEAEGN